MDSIVQCFIFLCLTTASFSTETGKTSITYGGDSVVSEGEPFQISCEVTAFDQIRWQKDGQTLHSDLGSNYTFEEKYKDDGVGRLALLSVPSAQTFHSGNYRCNSFSNQSHQFYVLSANQDQDNISYHFVAYRQSKPLELQCKIAENSNNLVLKWFKDDKVIDFKDLENKSHFEMKTLDNEENILIIHHPTDKDLGNYTCQLQSPNGNNSVEGRVNHFQVLSELIVRMEPSATVIEGEDLKLKCSVISKSPPFQIWWRFGNETYETSKDRVELKADDKNIPNAIFTMKEAVMEDRGEYTCMVFATPTSAISATVSEAGTYVRVKDKLAALWPFLGICAEVFVLCAIILIYEKKRNQAELEESDTDQSPDQKNTPDLGKDTVRQRK